MAKEHKLHPRLLPVDCGKCYAACCRGPGRVLFISQEEAEAKGLETQALGTLHYLKMHEDGTCWYLDTYENKCTIYENRPEKCKQFDCRDYADSVGMLDHIVVEGQKRLLGK